MLLCINIILCLFLTREPMSTKTGNFLKILLAFASKYCNYVSTEHDFGFRNTSSVKCIGVEIKKKLFLSNCICYYIFWVEICMRSLLGCLYYWKLFEIFPWISTDSKTHENEIFLSSRFDLKNVKHYFYFVRLYGVHFVFNIIFLYGN